MPISGDGTYDEDYDDEYEIEGNEQEALRATNILNEKRARKLAEDDAQRLYARVRNLEREEEKASKRISETRKKAEEIVKLRERNDLIKQEKELRQQQYEALLEEQRIENQKKNEEALRNRQEKEEQIYTEKVQVAQQTKEERAEIEKALMEHKLLSRKEALENKEAIRQQQDEARRKLEQLKLAKLQQAQEEYERRLKEEMDAKSAKEREIEQLAKLEMELIERLKTKQQEQKKAFQQLEAVLNLGSPSSPKTTAKKPLPSAQSPKARPPGVGSKKTAASKSSEPSEEDVARSFSAYDRDGTGSIDTKDIQSLLKDLKVPLNADQLAQAVGQLDPNKTSKVSFGEFLLWWKG